MKYLIVCDHRKQIIEDSEPLKARDRFTCKLCVKFSLKNSEWTRKDLRVYRASQPDIEIVMEQQKPAKHVRHKDETMDWVDQLTKHEASQ